MEAISNASNDKMNKKISIRNLGEDLCDVCNVKVNDKDSFCSSGHK